MQIKPLPSISFNRLFACAALSLAAIAAHADGRFYVGADVGSARQSVNYYSNNLFSSSAGTETSADANSTSWGAHAGYRFNHYVALELGYNDFGNINVGSGSSTAKASDVQGSVLLGLPAAQNLDVYARLGLASTRIAISANGGNSTNREAAAVYGLGADYLFDANWAARLEFTRVLNSNFNVNAGTNSYSIHSAASVISVGLGYRF